MAVPVYITGVASALPAQVFTNEELLAGMPWLDVSAEWVREHTGIRSRCVASEDQDAVDLGVQAALQSLQRAGVRAADTDLVLMGTNTSTFVYPAGAALIQGRLAELGHAMPNAAAMDLQQGCASFVAGIIMATAMIRGGDNHQVLVIGADVATRMVDWTDRSAMILGDGATACVVTDRRSHSDAAVPDLQVLGSFLRTVPDRDSIYQRGVLDPRNHPAQHAAFAAQLGGRVRSEQIAARLKTPPPEAPDHLFHMDGRKVYRFVRRTVPEPGFLTVLHRAGVVSEAELAQLATHEHPTKEDERLRAAIGQRVDRFVPHGANMVLDQELAEQMHIPYERMALTLQEHGNTSAASVGIALERILHGEIRYETIAKRDGHGNLTRPAQQVVVPPLRAGHLALLLSFGAGTSWNYVATRAV